MTEAGSETEMPEDGVSGWVSEKKENKSFIRAYFKEQSCSPKYEASGNRLDFLFLRKKNFKLKTLPLYLFLT